MTARTALTPIVITRAGVTTATPVAADATNFNTVANDGATWVEITNTDTNPHTVTIQFNVTVDGQAVTGVAHTLAAAAVKRYGPFPTAQYGGQLHLDADSVTVKYAVYHLG